VVTPALPTGESTFSFVAVNRGRIVRVGDPPRGPEKAQVRRRSAQPRKPKTAARK